MKNRTSYTVQLARWFSRHKRQCPKEPWPVLHDPLDHLCLAILSENGQPHRSLRALHRLHRYVVDLNDLRVSTPTELAQLIEGDVHDALIRATSLVRTLNALYEKENKVTLQELKRKTKKERCEYLHKLDTLSPYALSCTLLMGFNDHVIPLDEQMLQVLQREGLVDPQADPTAIRQFLQRHISAKNSRTFYGALKHCASRRAAPSQPATRCRTVAAEKRIIRKTR